ncbi:MAG: stage V sporulation protein AD [Syntrophothermus sp.]|uniref:stage V sporulation protein AD n=1 Tax=Syntrophothermus sp. TaxID=2736299 RepID=UPI002580FFAD|nr:stage V sporulation protein AD [Syntrophothermus sp.]NSW82312.1 stage V sporulation protein AD [Syntrophothermus sp.]
MPRVCKRTGQQSIYFENPPVITNWANIVGPMEGQGPYGKEFDWVLEDYLFGEQSWEKAEAKMLRETVKLVAGKANLSLADIEVFLAGDLLNQIISANFAARELKIPFLGLYGACSTMAEGIALGAMLVDGGFYSTLTVGVTSHHYTAERQFRFPTEQGSQRLPSSQWTVTGCGCLIIQRDGVGPRVTAATIGKVIDLGQSDVNDMGAAMAPAAADTIVAHFRDTGRDPNYYDLIITGDLGKYGLALMESLCQKLNCPLGQHVSDCGVLIYDIDQDVHAGGSGCGCSAVMLCGPLLNRMQAKEFNRILLVGTGALMSTTSSLQGETIPCIAHAVAIEN